MWSTAGKPFIQYSEKHWRSLYLVVIIFGGIDRNCLFLEINSTQLFDVILNI